MKQLLDHRENLAQKRADLRKFKFGKEESSVVLTLIDQNNNEFRTSSSNLIERLVHRSSALFSEKINEFTDEIIDFEF
ncbi:MAG: hypothetical protein KDC92_12310 [Bacteroidetes bacterium]|nr:hypothetical protein [Bacteroidota bacterium]